MPRSARRQSSTGYYHITNRGVGKAPVFCDAQDHDFFLECLRLAHGICEFSVLAYCIMTTHYHIVIRCDGPVPPELFQSIGARFANYYHVRHACSGQIFQGRFHSEAIESESHLLSAIRYVWRNPVSARMCTHPAAYPWNSYRDLGKPNDMIDNDLLTSFMSVAEWERFALEDAGARHVEPFPRRMDDERACACVRELCSGEDASVDVGPTMRSCPPALSRCIYAGVTIPQIARALGLARANLYRAFRRWGPVQVGACSAAAYTSP